MKQVEDFPEVICALCGTHDLLYDLDGEHQCWSCATHTIKEYMDDALPM